MSIVNYLLKHQYLVNYLNYKLVIFTYHLEIAELDPGESQKMG